MVKEKLLTQLLKEYPLFFSSLDLKVFQEHLDHSDVLDNFIGKWIRIHLEDILSSYNIHFDHSIPMNFKIDFFSYLRIKIYQFFNLEASNQFQNKLLQILSQFRSFSRSSISFTMRSRYHQFPIQGF